MNMPEKVYRVHRRHYRSHYFFYIVRILVEGQWKSGEEICQEFDEQCNEGWISNKQDGMPRKGFDYQQLFRQVIGYRDDAFLIECDMAPPHHYSDLHPWYKDRWFRIHPEWLGAVREYYTHYWNPLAERPDRRWLPGILDILHPIAEHSGARPAP
jgi:hypothetical protein